MNAATIILLALSHAGFWVGGQDQTIEMRWAVRGGLPNALVLWELSAANTTLASGQTDLPAGKESATLSIIAPEVRAPVEVRFTYRVIAVDDKRELTTGSTLIRLYPGQSDALKPLTEETPLLVIDKPERLPALLKRAGAKFDVAADTSALASAGQKIIVVGQDMLDPLHAAAVQALAEGGVSVILLRQTERDRVLQYDRAMRDAAGYVLHGEHPLLRHLPTEAWSSLLAGTTMHPALLFPGDEAALEIIHSPVEASAVRTAPLDVLLASRTVGRGRIIFCQLPLDTPSTDARQQQLLINLLEYARTRAQPTPARSQRIAAIENKKKEAPLPIGGEKP